MRNLYTILALVSFIVVASGNQVASGTERSLDVELAALHDGGLRQVTDNAAMDVEPKWSPDSTRLSFASNRTTTWNVWQLDRQSGELVQLTDDLEMVHSTWWAPGGKQIAVASAVRVNDGFLGKVFLLDVDDRSRRELTTGPVDGSPCWSPDGERIAFVSNRTGNWDIWLVPANGGAEKQLTHHEGFDHSPRWSPDGSMIAFHSARSGNGDIWLMSMTDHTFSRLTTSEAFDHFPTWSPDGRYVAFHSNRSGTFGLWVIPVTGGQAVQLTDGPHNDRRPSWSPDGTAIAFNSDRSGNEDIWLLNLPEVE